MYPISPTHGALTMSTREIAELTGKRHDHVLRDARNLLAELQSPKVGEITKMGRENLPDALVG
ncbi:Rha family transcriptional regulator [Edwardsiella tarda]|uniref:Rha family transcriptional regulator n=1 Tax=Edwardsiella tarda TaxID=636 RepID=UPI00351C42A8